MTATELMTELRQRGIELVTVDKRLRFRPRDAVDPSLLEQLRQHKGELLLMLWIDGLPPDWRAEFEDRAAIREYEGGQCREAAELDAIYEIRARMRAASKPT